MIILNARPLILYISFWCWWCMSTPRNVLESIPHTCGFSPGKCCRMCVISLQFLTTGWTILTSSILLNVIYPCFGLRVLSLPVSVCLCIRPSVRPSVCVCGKHLLVHAITHHPFKLGSLNLDPRCKRPWSRSLLFWGVIDIDLHGQIQLQSQNLPHFEFVHAMTHCQLKLQFPNLEQKCIVTLFRSLPILGLIEIDLQFNF